MNIISIITSTVMTMIGWMLIWNQVSIEIWSFSFWMILLGGVVIYMSGLLTVLLNSKYHR